MQKSNAPVRMDNLEKTRPLGPCEVQKTERPRARFSQLLLQALGNVRAARPNRACCKHEAASGCPHILGLRARRRKASSVRGSTRNRLLEPALSRRRRARSHLQGAAVDERRPQKLGATLVEPSDASSFGPRAPWRALHPASGNERAVKLDATGGCGTNPRFQADLRVLEPYPRV